MRFYLVLILKMLTQPFSLSIYCICTSAYRIYGDLDNEMMSLLNRV